MKKQCSNCNWLKKIGKYPGNDPPFKGPISATFGFVCWFPEDRNNAVFFDHDTGLCEMHMMKRGIDE